MVSALRPEDPITAPPSGPIDQSKAMSSRPCDTKDIEVRSHQGQDCLSTGCRIEKSECPSSQRRVRGNVG